LLFLFFSVCAILFALPLPSLTFAPSDPSIVVYGVSLSEEENTNGTIRNSSLAMTVKERTTQAPGNANSIRGFVTLVASGRQEDEIFEMSVRGENLLSNRDLMYASSIPNYRAFPMLPAGSVDVGSQWTTSNRARARTVFSTFDISVDHKLTEKTTRLGYDAVRIDYTYSGSPDVEPVGTYKFTEITGSGTAYFAFKEGFIVEKTEKATYTEETRKQKAEGGYEVLDSLVRSSNITVTLQNVQYQLET
jgi:hypothetical protein